MKHIVVTNLTPDEWPAFTAYVIEKRGAFPNGAFNIEYNDKHVDVHYVNSVQSNSDLAYWIENRVKERPLRFGLYIELERLQGLLWTAYEVARGGDPQRDLETLLMDNFTWVSDLLANFRKSMNEGKLDNQ